MLTAVPLVKAHVLLNKSAVYHLLSLLSQYIYMIRGEELTRLARDYIKYLFGAKSSMRLKRAMYKWQKFYESIVRKEEVREDWLERAIVATPTWWHNPRKLARLMESIYQDYMRQETRRQETES